MTEKLQEGYDGELGGICCSDAFHGEHWDGGGADDPEETGSGGAEGGQADPRAGAGNDWAGEEETWDGGAFSHRGPPSSLTGPESSHQPSAFWKLNTHLWNFCFTQRFPVLCATSATTSCSDIFVHSDTCLGAVRRAAAHIEHQLQSFVKRFAFQGQLSQSYIGEWSAALRPLNKAFLVTAAASYRINNIISPARL